MSKEAFKTQYGPAAKRAADKLDVPEDVILAHWGLETGWGKSVVPGTNNLGNIKDFAGGGVAAKDNLTGTTDKYRTFDTAEAFADHYADLIVRKHPGAVGKKTGMDFGNGLRATGYMEDAAAPQKLARIMKEPVQDMPAPVPDQRVAAISAGIRASIQRPLPLSGSKARLDAEVNTDRSVAEAQAFAAPSLWESFAGAVAGNTDSEIYKGITERIWGPKHQPEAGYLPDFEMLKERTAGAADRDMVEDFGKTRSAAEAEEMLNKYDDEQMRIKAVMGNGTAIGMGMTFLAEVPAFSNILPGVGVAKALAKVKMGSQFLAMEGAGYGKVAAAAIGENAISGAGVEAVRQMATGEYNLADFGLAIAVDSVIGAAAAGLDMRTAGKLSIDNAAAASVAREFDLHQRAVAKLGPDASSAEIKQAVQEIATTELSAAVSGAVTRGATLKLNGDAPAMRTLTRGAADAPENRVLIDGAGAYPTVNISDEVGRLQREAPESPEFKEFFGNSRAVDPTGKPVVVYHLTKAENLEAFDKDKLGSNTGVASAKEGFFFAGDPSTVNVYANTAADTGSTPNVIPVYLSLQNPFEFDMGGSLYRKRSYASILREAKQKGHDGVIIRNTFDGGSKDDIYVAFEPTQIKSAISNTGAYSKDDPRISYDLQTSTRFANSANALEERRISTLDKRWGELRQLGLDLPDDNTAAGRAAAIAALDATPKVHIASNAKSSLKFAQYGEALESLRKQFLPDVAIHITDGKARLQGNNLGVHAIVKPGVSVLGLRTDSGMATAIHEFGHAVFAHRLARLPEAEKQAMEDAWREWQQKYMTPGKAQEAALQRSPVGTAGRMMPDGSEPFAAAAAKGDFSEAFADVWDKAFPGNQAQADAYARYYGNFDEYSAEQFAKYIEAEVAGVGSGKLTLPQQIVRAIAYLIQQAAEIFKFAKAKKLIKPDEPFAKFFDDLIMGNKAKGLTSADEALASGLEFMAVPAKPAAVVDEFMNDPDAARFGLTIAPVSTAMERKQAQAMLALHKKAEEWAKTHPKDAEWDARAQNLADNNVYSVASAGMVMLKSESPLLRMIASELVEDASGISGKRNSTAAISKYITERFMLGNAINDIEGAYGFWAKGKPGGIKDDLIGGKNRAEFDRLIASEIEARRDNRGALTQDPNVKAAADSTEAAYQRIANEQRRVQTIGWEGLPESSKGYMPHRMSAKAVINLTNEQGRVLHDALVDQFVTVEGWDMSFSDKLASTYMKRVRDRASGDYGSSFGGNTSAESDVEEALRAMDLPEDVIEGHMKKFKKGGAGFTKGRIELDLNRPHMLADGSEFKLLSVFETNQIELLRAQAGRASGEVALTKHGVQGKPGLKLLRDALSFGEDGKRAAVRELEAFDQMAAEFMNEPFGKSNNRFLQRAMAANTLVRLGGIAFNQLAESINGIVHVGVGRTLSSIGSIKRLRSEIIALSKGQKVDNPLLSSIELAGGQFGTDAYKFVLPYDSPDHLYPTYGQDTLTAADRLLRGGTHVQSVLSGWRMIHSAQQRGMAEQIVHKMMRYVREGKDDVALEQFGINARVRAQLRADLPQVAKFDGNTLVEFDVTKISDPAVRDEVIQAVWRGTAQIIQGTFIGETAKWAHSDLGKLMTQFRTFSLTSMEKQWGRQRNSRGAYAAFGILMGSMAMAAPIYMARVYAASVGREDQGEFLAERLETQAIARATLNYVAMSGMAGDFMDLLSAGLPEELGVKPTGGRAGVESTFIGNYVAPASSLVDDIWKYAQSPADMNDLTKIMPMSRLPYLVPLVNEAKE